MSMPRSRVATIFLLTCHVAVTWLEGQPARGEVGPTDSRAGRKALVIGNSSYPGGRLSSPENDARDMAEARSDH